MKRRRTAVDQAFAHPRHQFGGELADRIAIVAVGLHALADPARDLGAAGFGKAAQLGEVGDRHDPRYHRDVDAERSEEHTSELQSLMRISYAVFCLKTKNTHT